MHPPSLAGVAARAAALIAFGLAIIALGLLFDPAWPRDRGQYAQVDPAIREWFDGLKNQNGTPCCSVTDGLPLQDADWRRNPDGTYAVLIEGNWADVSPAAVLTGRNRVGYAVVWIHYGVILCFMPGSEG